MKIKSGILKIALFATGLSGIVAEYILSTLATYFLGDSVLQWTMIVSIMMFSMGLGSRISRFIKKDLLQNFIIIEFTLSFFVGFSSLFAYSAAAYTVYTGLIIYSMSIVIGCLIGMEIPLVVRLNDEFETLRINVASVIEKDYYGSLVGGVLYALVALPYIGLTYTPFILAAINFSVAFVMYLMLRKNLIPRMKLFLNFFAAFVTVVLLLGSIFATPIILHGEQKKYKDLVIYTEQSRYQRIVITQWKNHYWLFINGSQQFCTLDEVVYHEPLVHPIMQMVQNPVNVLVLGGGDGCAIREILKYSSVENITLVDLDPSMTTLANTHEVLLSVNEGSLKNSKVKIINKDGYNYLEDCNDFFDVIIVDLPDPKSVELGRLYSAEFYSMCYMRLRPNGAVITQAGSPYYASRAFFCINETMSSVGFGTLPIHTQILTLGEWGWVIGSKNFKSEEVKKILLSLQFNNVETNWINNDAMQMMCNFGKNIYPEIPYYDTIEINTIHNPVLYRYYLKGNWDLY